jgi:hypothetical protein
MVWCRFEQAEFPESDFYESVDYGTVHRKRPLHNTRGDAIEESEFESAEATDVDSFVERDA